MFDSINFKAEIRDLYDANGNRVDADKGRGVYRSDTGELLSIVGRNHKIIDHMDVVMPVLDSFEAQGYQVMEREPDLHSLYDLKGKKGVFVTASTSADGAMMRTDIICGDFVEPKPSMRQYRHTDGRDTMFHRVTLLNSHDGSTAVHCNTSYLRLVCLNGMVRADWTASARAKHTSGVQIEALRAKIANAARMMASDADMFSHYASTKVSVEQATEFFERTIAKLAPGSVGKSPFSESLVAQLVENFKREDQTAWGLWNAMTQWSTHGPRRESAGSLTTTLARESRVALAMRTKEWEAILN
jgi:hypothetical protein